MNQYEFKWALDHLGLTQKEAGDMLGIAIRTVHGYCHGTPVPEPTARLLLIILKYKLYPEDVLALVKEFEGLDEKQLAKKMMA